MDDETRTIKFRQNASDDLHCFQACLSMVLSYFCPEEAERSFDELDTISGKKPKKYTWPFHALMYLSNRGFHVVDMDMFDYIRFATEGKSYLLSYYGSGAGLDQIKNSDIPYEQEVAKQYATSGINRQAIPTRSDIESYINLGYLVLCFVDSARMNGGRKPIGHFVLVSGHSDEGVVIQDPGLNNLKRGVENRSVDWDRFEYAWNYGDTDQPNLIAIKRC